MLLMPLLPMLTLDSHAEGVLEALPNVLAANSVRLQ